MFICIEDLQIPADASKIHRSLLENQVEGLNAMAAVSIEPSYYWMSKGLVAYARSIDHQYSLGCRAAAHAALEGYLKIATMVKKNNTAQQLETIRGMIDAVNKVEVSFAQLHAIETGTPLSLLEFQVTLH